MGRATFTGAAVAVMLSTTGLVDAHGQTPEYAGVTAQSVNRTTVIAGTLLLTVGSQDDPPGLEGTAWLTGQTLSAQARRALAGSGASVTVTPGRSTTAVTLTAVPESWPAAWSNLEALIFDRPLSSAAFDDEQRRARNQLTFRMASPVTDFESRAFAQLVPPSDAWAASPMGGLESLARITAPQAEAFRAEHYRRDLSVVAVVGSTAPGTADPEAPRSGVAAPLLAWQAGDRTELTEDVTSAWISVAYPVPSNVDRTALEFVVDLIHDALDPVPADPNRYSVDVRIEDTPAGPAVVAQIAVTPEAADRWESRTLDAVSSLIDAPPTGVFFDWARRRFRSRRLLADARPDQASTRMAADLLRDGSVRDLDGDIWRLTPEKAAAILRGFGRTRILRLGPDLGLAGR